MTAQPTRDQLRALADAATPGPWAHADYGDPNPEHWPVGLIEDDDGDEVWKCDTALAMSEPDAKFIAAARTATPHYLDQLDQADARIEAVIELHKPVMTYRLIDGEDFAQEPDAHVCMECRALYPCPTIQALDATQQD